MDKQSRRDAIRDYKERKILHGVYAVRCAATGQSWIGVATNVAQMQNRIWFALRQGGHPNPELRAAWQTHGEPAFSFEVLEQIDTDDLGPVGRESLLKARTAYWRAETGAAKIVG